MGHQLRIADHDGLEIQDLSPAAERFIAEHPDQAKLAVTVALETAARQYEPALADLDVPESLRPFLVDSLSERNQDEMINATEACKRLQVSRATIYNWIRENRLVSWQLTRQGSVIPAEQILGPGEVVDGIADVVNVIGDARSAWRFLTEDSGFFDSPARPIDLLKKGMVKEVLAAAESQGDAFS